MVFCEVLAAVRGLIVTVVEGHDGLAADFAAFFFIILL